YDLRDEGLVSPIRDQNPYGTCWAFAVFASMESNIKITTGMPIDFSEWHLSWFAYNSWNGWPAFEKYPLYPGEHTTFDQGGEEYMSLAMLTRGTGPVSEASAPYLGPLPTGNEITIATVKNCYLFETTDKDTIKGLVLTNGALYFAYYHGNSYYSSANKTYRYTGNSESNHAVSIVGWNDEYPRTNFPSNNRPASDGAWIVRNNWGASWGESGYYYMAYDSRMDWFASFEGSLIPDKKIYQYDLLGIYNNHGLGSDTAWFSNIFTATADDTISDVSFYTSTAGASYEITVNTGVTGNPATGAQASETLQGVFDAPGYRRVKLTSPVAVQSGDKFAVIVKLTESGYDYPIPIGEQQASPGECFYSSDGTIWTQSPYVICLKAFGESDAALNPVSVTVSPKTATLTMGAAQTFTAEVTGGFGNTDVTWTATGGMITQNGVYTAPATPGGYTITATSLADSTKSDTATVTVVPGAIAIISAPAALFPGDTATFLASVTDLSSTDVTWTASAGYIDQQGRYTAPAEPQDIAITVVSVMEPLLSASADVRINNPGMTEFDGNKPTAPQFLGLSGAFGSRLREYLNKYDLNNDGVVDEGDLTMLYKVMGW
ncbi:MAG: lectin like domain-containing protein, partial [Holophagales bacterium]|nr:lectin like domain-containing protein [Holophagales bacterium]